MIPGRIIVAFHFGVLLDSHLLKLLVSCSVCDGEGDTSAKICKNIENSTEPEPFEKMEQATIRCSAVHQLIFQKVKKCSKKPLGTVKSISGQECCSIELHGVNCSLQLDKSRKGERMSLCTGISSGGTPLWMRAEKIMCAN